jgi:hypothetical protein
LFPTSQVYEICWINHGANNKQHERQKMLLCFGFYEVITSQYAHYPFATCAYVCKISYMWNACIEQCKTTCHQYCYDG